MSVSTNRYIKKFPNGSSLFLRSVMVIYAFVLTDLLNPIVLFSAPYFLGGVLGTSSS